jgi:hypothetical protein
MSAESERLRGALSELRTMAEEYPGPDSTMFQIADDALRGEDEPGCDDDGKPSPAVEAWIFDVLEPAVAILAKLFTEQGLSPSRADRLARTCIARLAKADPPITVELLGSVGRGL